MGLVDELKKEMIAKDALIFYQCSGEVYIEHRNIKDGYMCAGQPLSVEQLAKMLRCVEKYTKEHSPYKSIGGPVPPCLLYASTSIENMHLVWWRKPEERKMYFSDHLDIPNGVLRVPGMVYSVKNNILSVWCFRSHRPRNVLYKAPFFNIYNDGHVCLGNSKAEKPINGTFQDWISYWEKLFWQSEFDAIIGENPIEGNLASITKNCITKGIPFPVDTLKRVKVKLNELLK